MNSLIRSTARCMRSGAAACLLRPADGLVRAASARFLCAAADLQKDLGEMVKKDKVVVFMKGTPAQPMCGFSNAVVQILRMHGVDQYASYNVLEDQELREVLCLCCSRGRPDQMDALRVSAGSAAPGL
ncbi:PREDICTED: glutaredoxin-related protein 5, mitochondrial isoform X2 [Poecilia mexicana]|uniref:glutaredoxin-related protein 5, mitochondrial isoform X2 n=1 Tax=Poecilia mexicana TaxID=48701 RepID=UPI00072DB678|nr:PREDICTED: glutaredoxin-related protein 5, mitochondrial isoform X2 [Poecilia mexicana]